jgi:hypothetical protein
MTKRNVIRMAMPSYKDAFNKAKNPQNTNTNSNSNINSNSNKKATVEVKKQPQVITRNDDDLDDLPFTDEMYDHLKYVIGALTARMKSEKPLTESELKRFKGSIDAIILDSKEDSYQNDTYDNSDDSNSFYNENEDDSINYEQEETSNTNTNTNTLKASASTTETIGDNPFSQFRGSTWNFDNMEDMSTEEYYDALNERLAAMKKRKLEVYERDELNNPSESYFENLSRKNRV